MSVHSLLAIIMHMYRYALTVGFSALRYLLPFIVAAEFLESFGNMNDLEADM